MDTQAYNVAVKWTETRKGIVSSPEVNSVIEVATPPPFDKGIAGIWSPEHLLTASVASCFMTTFLAIADYSRLEYAAFECRATGILEKSEGKFQITEIKLNPVIKICDEKDRDKAMRILSKTEAACFIAHSVKAKVTLSPIVQI